MGPVYWVVVVFAVERVASPQGMCCAVDTAG